jgi:nicotinate-nucleotide--dimethylbenzimidazole phosphoribosyltransferase
MDLQAQLQHKLNTRTKPTGSLGQLEELALQIGLLQGSTSPVLSKPTLVIFAGDHGIAREGVSAYPSEVTARMVNNFVSGGAAASVLCRLHGMDLKVVDAGVDGDLGDIPGLLRAKVGYGTRNFAVEPAMSAAELDQCLACGASVSADLAADGCNVLALGEMGIGNTSAASLLMAEWAKVPLEECVGRGTGLDSEGLRRKIRVLGQAMSLHGPQGDPMELMQTYGGFEMAQMAGAMMEAGRRNMTLLIDGFIATAVFAWVLRIKPELKSRAVFSHVGEEQGHRLLLQILDARPLLDLRLRLGEGSGAVLAYPILRSAVALLNEMASFEEAGIPTSLL